MEFEGGKEDVEDGGAVLFWVGVVLPAGGSKVVGAGVDGIEGCDVNMGTEEWDEEVGGGKEWDIEFICVVDVPCEEFAGLGIEGNEVGVGSREWEEASWKDWDGGIGGEEDMELELMGEVDLIMERVSELNWDIDHIGAAAADETDDVDCGGADIIVEGELGIALHPALTGGQVP